MYTNLIENFLTIEECNFIINQYKLNSQPVFNSTNVIERRCMFVESIEFNIKDKIINKLNELNIFDKQYTNIQYFVFNSYESENELELHTDSSEVARGATITIIVQLNENYDGGDFYYSLNDEETILAKKRGSIFIFDSNILHGVKKMTNGERYSLNCWPK
jgi:predicted 2-oxoglutarate/Fe(II)-dependent dioxygenase YbiX